MIYHLKAVLLAGVVLSAMAGCGASQTDAKSPNLVHDPAMILRQTYWTPSSPSIRIETGNGEQGSRVSISGTNKPSGFEYVASSAIVVEPGKVYTLSGQIDGTGVLSGRPEWAVFDPTLKRRMIASAAIDFGLSARVSTSFQMPQGVTLVRILCDTNNAVVALHRSLTFSQPALRLGGSSAYASNPSIGS